MLPFKRRREKKTDYRARLAMLKSDRPRLVVRRGTANIRVQLVEYTRQGDKTLVDVNSRALQKLGWKGHCGNIPAAYLAGFAAGKRALAAGIKNAVLDIGLHTSTKGNAVYAAARGAVDAGLELPLNDEVVPKEERIKGVHIAEYRGTDTAKNFGEVLENMKMKKIVCEV